MLPENKSERVLFFSLWALLILACAIWRFWPRPELLWSDPPPAVELARELQPWFDRGTVTKNLPSGYTVKLDLNPQYRERLGGGEQDLRLRFHLRGEGAVLFEGVAPCHVRAEDESVEITVRNPRRIVVRGIGLSLAH